ncbi:MAG: DUF1559 domain-containing protein, partial [Planctomycetales bacterium]
GSMAKIGRWSVHVDLLPFMEKQNLHAQLDIEIQDGPTIRDLSTKNQFINVGTGEMPTVSDIQWGPLEDVMGGDSLRDQHQIVATTYIDMFNCPSDLSPEGVTSSSNYCPVVSTANARYDDPASGPVITGLWPADNENLNGLPVPLGVPNFSSEVNMISLGVLSALDGTSNTAGMVERVKGVKVTGRPTELNQAVSARRSGYHVVDGVIQAPGNHHVVSWCKDPTLAIGNQGDYSGSIWIQHTCRLLGCANMMAPPNVRPCVGVAGENIAYSGTAGPSSYHGDGANVGMMDGTVRWLSSEADLFIVHALGTPAGNENHPWKD